MSLATSPKERDAIAAVNPLDVARRVIGTEAAALHSVADRLGPSFEEMVQAIWHCQGRVAVTGIGKSADVGQKLVGTLNSTGTRAYLLDATRAVHGDLGMLHPDDLALVLSHSGESDELLRLIGPLKKMAATVLAITGNARGTLARTADVAIVYGPIVEACPLALAPSTSTTVMIALGDAIAFCLLELRRFSAEDFARFHPAGSLGRKLATVESYMRSGDELRTAPAAETVRQVFARVRHSGRRTGAVILIHDDGRLAGLFTDSDLARLFERRDDNALDQPIARVMTANPLTIGPDARMAEAIDILSAKKISELPVVDEHGRPIGMIDITDLIGMVPDEANPATPPVLRLQDGRGQ